MGSVVGYGAAPGPRPNRFGFRMPLNPCLQSRGLLPKLSGQCNWKARFLVSWSLAFAHHDRKTCSREVALCCTIRISRLTKLLLPSMPSVSDMRHEVQSEKLSLLRMLGMPDDAQTIDMSWFVDWLCEVLLPAVMILYHLHITSVLPLIINSCVPYGIVSQVIQVKPQLEQLLKLPDDSLTKVGRKGGWILNPYHPGDARRFILLIYWNIASLLSTHYFGLFGGQVMNVQATCMMQSHWLLVAMLQIMCSLNYMLKDRVEHHQQNGMCQCVPVVHSWPLNIHIWALLAGNQTWRCKIQHLDHSYV